MSACLWDFNREGEGRVTHTHRDGQTENDDYDTQLNQDNDLSTSLRFYVSVPERETERDRERQRETERETHRERDRERDRDRETDRQRQTDRE